MRDTLKQHYTKILGLDDSWRILHVDLDIQKIHLTIEIESPRGTKLPCPICGRLCSKEDSSGTRSWRHLDTMQFETILKCKIPRVRCPVHKVKTVKVPWANSYSRFTNLFEEFTIDVIKTSKSITAASKLLRLSWKQIFRIKKMAVERGLYRRNISAVTHLGVDEKNFLKGHSYISVLNDLNNGCVIDVVEGRTKKDAIALLEGLPSKQREYIDAVAMDMWKPFIQASKTVFPNADIVHDKYHGAGYLGKAVDSVRKQENRDLVNRGEDILKGTKYLWLTNPDNLGMKVKLEFESLVRKELKVSRAWSIKESFRHIWDYSYLGAAMNFFKRWYFWATHSKLKPIIKAAKTIKRHLEGIIAYLEHHITNAISEGINSKIQSIKANARGFRNFKNYRISILFHCGNLDLYP